MAASPKDDILGIRLITESVSPGSQTSSTISLFAHDRSRTGSAHPDAAYRIERRDQKKTIDVYPQKKKYRELPIFNLLSDAEKDKFAKSGKHWRKRHNLPEQPPDGMFRIQTIYEKTSEQEQLFGCAVYRWKITRREQRDHSYGTDVTETTTDAWYLDPIHLSEKYSGFSQNLLHHTTCYVTINHQRPQIEHIGQRPSGLCAHSESCTIRRHTLANGETREIEEHQSSRISSLTRESFPESLFEVPNGFTRMPVYPGRITMVRLDLKREIDRLRHQLRQRIRPLFGHSS